MNISEWPKWMYGPNGEARIFQKDDVVPKGWEDHPSKVGTAGQSAGKGPEPTSEEKVETIRSVREAAAAAGIKLKLADDASVEEINAAIDKLTAAKG